MAAPASDAPRIRVAAILSLSGGIVLVRHRKGTSEYHLLPGGGVHRGESLGEALVREVKEETGLTCDPGAPVILNDSIAPDSSRHVVQITFLAKVLGGSLHQTDLDERVEAVELVQPPDLFDLDLRPPIAAEILEALALEAGPGARYLARLWSPIDEVGDPGAAG